MLPLHRLLRRRMDSPDVDQTDASRDAHIRSRMLSVRMTSFKLNAALDLTSIESVPDAPLPLTSSAEDSAANNTVVVATNYQTVSSITQLDGEQEDADEEVITPTRLLPPRNPMGFVQRLESYLNTHYLQFRNILEFWIQDVTSDAVKMVMHRNAGDMAKMRIHQIDLSDVAVDGDGVGRVEGHRTGAKWIWFLLESKRENGGGWTAFGCPAEAIRVVRDERIFVVGPDGNAKPIQRVDMLFSFGGIPLFDGLKVDYQFWAGIGRLMATGCCLITYFFDPFVAHQDHMYDWKLAKQVLREQLRRRNEGGNNENQPVRTQHALAHMTLTNETRWGG